MSDDPQDIAQDLDDDVLVGGDRLLSDEERPAFPPDTLRGFPDAGADATDESLADRARQEEPEAWERPVTPGDDDRAVVGDEDDTVD